jgi:hypothetical protein
MPRGLPSAYTATPARATWPARRQEELPYAEGVALGVDAQLVAPARATSPRQAAPRRLCRRREPPLCRGLCRRRMLPAVNGDGPPLMIRRGRVRRGARRPSVYDTYAEGYLYADGTPAYAEGPRRRGQTPRAAVGVAYAEGQAWLRRGQPAVGVVLRSCSDWRRVVPTSRGACR